jgi:hypothetical protein
MFVVTPDGRRAAAALDALGISAWIAGEVRAGEGVILS